MSVISVPALAYFELVQLPMYCKTPAARKHSTSPFLKRDHDSLNLALLGT